MKRYYFVSDDLDGLTKVGKELKQGDVSPLQMHLLPSDDVDVGRRGLDSVDSLFRKDILPSLLVGFGIGCGVVALLLVSAFILGVRSMEAWFLVGFLSVIVLGFCTWEGGLFGIQVPNREFRRFTRHLQDGQHVFFVDVEDDDQQKVLDRTVARHGHLQPAGVGDGKSEWKYSLRRGWRRFRHAAP